MEDEYMKKAEKLLKAGYQGTSNAYCLVSRIDRPDWREHMGASHVEGMPERHKIQLEHGMKWVNGLGNSAADHYRRCFSKDTITVSSTVYKAMKILGSGRDFYEFMEKENAVIHEGV